MPDEVFEKGVEIRRHMFGDALTEAHLTNADDFNRDLQELVTRYCFGEVWTRQTIPPNIRSMLTIGMLAALGRQEQLRGHVLGALANGVSREEIKEVLLHAAIYCGVPAAVASFQTATDALAQADAAGS